MRFFWCVVILSVVVGSDECGASDSLELEFPSTVQTIKTTTKRKRPAPSVKEKSGFSLIIPSIVYHGIQPEQSVAGEMTRKLDSDGRMVVTPGFGFSYEGPGDGALLAMIAGVKDCYDNFAGMFQIGQSYKVSSTTSWGYTLGLYVRETPMSCTSVTTYQSINGAPGRPAAMQVSSAQSCSEFDNYPWKSVAYLNGNPIDLIPMPFLHFSTALYKDANFQIDLKIMTNYVLNEVGFGIPF